MATRLASAVANASADAATATLDAGPGPGYIEIRTGAQPATVATAATGTLLATIQLNDPAFGDAANGVCTLDTDPALTGTGFADGTAGWFRAYDSTGAAILDGTCGTSGAQLNLSTTTITTGLEVTITSGTYTQPLS